MSVQADTVRRNIQDRDVSRRGADFPANFGGVLRVGGGSSDVTRHKLPLLKIRELLLGTFYDPCYLHLILSIRHF